MALTTYEKRAIARITREKTDVEREAIGQDDTLARELIAAGKERKLAYAIQAVENLTRDLAEWQAEKEIWENVEGLPENANI
jgi:hypothetical protein